MNPDNLRIIEGEIVDFSGYEEIYFGNSEEVGKYIEKLTELKNILDNGDVK